MGADDRFPVDFMHTCAFCTWRRASHTAIVLPAGCPQCGGAVDSAPHEERPGPDALAAVETLSGSRAARLLVLAFAAALVCACARLGHNLGGLSGATTAVGAAGYLLLPFVPERL